MLSTGNRTAIARQSCAAQVFQAGPYEIRREDRLSHRTGRLVRRYRVSTGQATPPRTIVHYRRLYSAEEVHEMLRSAGLVLSNIFGNFAAAPFEAATSAHAVYVSRRA